MCQSGNFIDTAGKYVIRLIISDKIMGNGDCLHGVVYRPPENSI